MAPRSTTIGIETLDKLKKDCKEFKSAAKDMGKDNKRLQKVLKDRDAEVLELNNGMAQAEADRDLAIKERDELKVKLKECMKALTDAGKGGKFEQVGDVLKHTQNWIKEWGFRTTKFAIKDTVLVKFCGKSYDALKDKFGWEDHETRLEKEEYVRIYKEFIQVKLSNQRQYSQSQLQKAVLGTQNSFVSFPKFVLSYPKLCLISLKFGGRNTRKCLLSMN